MNKIYFDYASTTPTDESVLAAMMPFFSEKFGNAASPHTFGREAQRFLEDSRETVAQCLGAQREEILFTSGGTEANNLALIGVARQYQSRGRHIIVSKIEHPSVLETAQFLEQQGWTVTYLPVDQSGMVSSEAVRQAITTDTILVSLMHANNEIGTIQPIAQVGAMCRERKILFHVDGVQTVGHIPVDVKAMSIDLLTISGHKCYGPKGIGALFIRKGVELKPILFGGNQERGLRPSTQNVAACVGLGLALKQCLENMPKEITEQTQLRDRLIQVVPTIIPGVIVNGSLEHRLPNNAHFAFSKIQSESLLVSLDMVGISASMGSACKAGAMSVSHVLKAIHLDEEFSHGALRVTLGRQSTSAHIDYFLEQLPNIIKQLRV